MSTPDGAIPERVQRWADTPLLVATLGSSLLAVPGLWGFAIIGWMAVAAPLEPGLDRLAVRLLVSAVSLGLPLLGFYLLAGYWRAGLRGKPSDHPRRFWSLSAVYNGLGLVVAALAVVVEVGEGGVGIPLMLSVPHTAWTGFMVRLGVTRARQAPTA